mgnify:CR=1 FL=1
MFFPLVAVTWDTMFAILGVQNLLFHRPGASIFHPGHNFVSLETFEGAMEGHIGARSQIFSDCD